MLTLGNAGVCLSENEPMNHKSYHSPSVCWFSQILLKQHRLTEKNEIKISIIYSAQAELFLTDIYLFICDGQMSEPQSLLFLIMKLVSDRQTS